MRHLYLKYIKFIKFSNRKTNNSIFKMGKGFKQFSKKGYMNGHWHMKNIQHYYASEKCKSNPQ